MSKTLYDLSDQLFQLRRDFLPHEVGGVFLSDVRVRQLTAGLQALGQEALLNAHEISRHRWNEAARQDRDVEDRIVEEAMRPGTNLRLLSHLSRSFSAGLPGEPA